MAIWPPGRRAQTVSSSLPRISIALAPRGLVFLSVSRTELLEQRALSLPHERVVLCLRPAGPLDEDLSEAIDRHAMRGFRLALDAGELAAVDGPLLDRAQTVIVEVGTRSSEELLRVVASVRERLGELEVVAGGVESRRSFQICRQVGFDLFQGQFVLRPTAGPAQTVAECRPGWDRDDGRPGRHGQLRAPGGDHHARPRPQHAPVRYANSAHMALPRRVGSVHEALAWLGTVAVREFALIAAVADVPEAPAEMLVTALTRARMCQELSRRLPATSPEESFTVGLFSVAEAVANAPIEVLVGELPLREDIAAALVDGAGELGRLLRAVIAYECGDLAPAMALTGGSGPVASTYLESVRWADSAVKAVA